MIGYKPEKLKIFYRSAIDVKFAWDEAEANKQERSTLSVFPAFAADATNPKTCETGKTWAGGYMVQNPKTFNWETTCRPQEIEVDNSAISDVQIVSLEHRSEGGRAYKVIAKIADLNLYFDLREDVLLEAMLSVGVQAGGILNGTYCFATVGSQMKLIRVDSELYNQVIEAGTRRKAKNIGQKDFKVGHVYSNRKNEWMLYGGIVDSQLVEEEKRVAHSYRSSLKWQEPVDIKKMQLWITAKDYVVKREQDPKKVFDVMFDEDYYWCFSMQKSATVVEEVADLCLTTQEICDKIHECAKRKVEEKDRSGWTRNDMIQEFRQWLCVHPTGLSANYEEMMR